MRLVRRDGGVPLGAIFLGIGLVGVAAVGLLHLDRLPFSLCAFKAITGYPCMTCGVTRTMGLLFVGKVAAAMTMNPLATLAAVPLLAWGMGDLLLMRKHAAVGIEIAPRLRPFLQAAVAGAVVANWAYLIASAR